jgi:hypothetical protein
MLTLTDPTQTVLRAGSRMLKLTVKAYGLKELYLKLTLMDKNELVVPDG